MLEPTGVPEVDTLDGIREYAAMSARARKVADLKQGQPAEFSLIALEDLALMPLPESVVSGLIPAQSTTLLVGASGVGKSFLAIDLLLSIAAGIPWCGRQVQQGSVVYIPAEGWRGVYLRCQAWEVAHDTPLPFGRFYLVPEISDLAKPESLERLRAQMRVLSPAPSVIAIDTFSASAPSVDENTANQVSSHLSALSRLGRHLGAAVIIVHHTGRDSRGPRGSTAFTANVDAVLEFKEHRQDSRQLNLIVRKQRDDSSNTTVSLYRHVVSLPGGETSCALLPIEGIDKSVEDRTEASGGGSNQPLQAIAMLDVLRKLVAERGHPEQGVSHGDWMEACLHSGLVSRRSYFRQRKKLVANGRIQELPSRTPARKGDTLYRLSQ